MNNKISIIIPIYNRPDELEELLDSILSQDTQIDYDVIVVEDGSEITSENVYCQYSHLMPISYYQKPNSGPGASRNFGMERAKGDYFVILDSDCILPKGYFEQLQKIVESDHVPDAFGGPDAAHRSFTDIQKAINYSMTSFWTTGGLRGGKKGNVHGARQLRSYNMVISRKAYEISGGFARQRVGEDIEYTLRLWRNDLSTAWYQDLFVYHKRRASLEGFFKQMKSFGRARPILNRMFPGMAKVTYMFPSIFLAFMILSFLGGVFAPVVLLPFLLYMLLIFVTSCYVNKSMMVGLLSVAAAVVQFVGYGYGFVWSSVRLIYYGDVVKAYPYMFKH